jgi:putative addiction module component (TIGR02574 family)
MVTEANAILERALALPAIERAQVAGKLLESLDHPDPAIDAIWADEAETRISAFEAGKIHAVSEEEAFAETAG